LVSTSASKLFDRPDGKRIYSCFATNGAGMIHDFELALIGQTSENVPDALGKGRFGMAYEFAFFREPERLVFPSLLSGSFSVKKSINVLI
jgi:hypothetical protein